MSAYLCKVLLHGVGETVELVLGLALEVRDPVRQLAVGGVEVLEHLPLVAVHLLLHAVEEGGAVAGVAAALGTLEKIYVVLKSVMFP